MIATPPPVPLETLLSRSWALYRRNWIVALPPVIAMVIVLAGMAVLLGTIFIAALANGGYERGGSPQLGAGFVLSVFLFAVVAVTIGVWAQAAMFGMADAAWVKGTTSFADGFTAFRRRGFALIVAAIGIAGLAIAAFILALPTLGLALLALPLVTLYVVPSIVAGGRGGFTAIGESFRLVRRFFGTSAVVLLVLLGIQYGIGLLASAPILPIQMAIVSSFGTSSQPHVPATGLLVFGAVWFALAMLVGQAYTGFYAIAIVGLYRSLFAQPGPAEPALGPLVTA